MRHIRHIRPFGLSTGQFRDTSSPSGWYYDYGLTILVDDETGEYGVAFQAPADHYSRPKGLATCTQRIGTEHKFAGKVDVDTQYPSLFMAVVMELVDSEQLPRCASTRSLLYMASLLWLEAERGRHVHR